MVILERLPGLEVEVHVNGEPATEFASDDLQDEQRQATRYIEAVSGAEFNIQWTFHAAEFKYRNWAINGIVHVDGKYADGRIFRPDAVKHQDSFTVKMSGVWKKEKGRYVERPMMFSDIMMGMYSPSAIPSSYCAYHRYRRGWSKCCHKRTQGEAGPSWRDHTQALPRPGSPVGWRRKPKGL